MYLIYNASYHCIEWQLLHVVLLYPGRDFLGWLSPPVGTANEVESPEQRGCEAQDITLNLGGEGHLGAVSGIDFSGSD